MTKIKLLNASQPHLEPIWAGDTALPVPGVGAKLTIGATALTYTVKDVRWQFSGDEHVALLVEPNDQDASASVW